MSDRPHSPLSGRYRLLSAVGEGGMGRVWHARDELLGRDVAVKEITAEGLSRTELGDLRERAIREARAIARISHPSVVRIFDVVDDADTPWIVMELIRSRSLQEVIEQDGAQTPEEAARIGLAVLAGLRAVHRVGILHRDVKPANVLLSADGRVVLTDFGLATLAGDSSMTRTGVVIGSPSYLAPERALDEPADAKSDLWSLGATLFTVIEGRAPFKKSSPMATLSALMMEPPPVSERAGVLQPVLAALLRKDPAERADADEAERLLHEALTGDPPPVRPAEPVLSVAPSRPGPASAAGTAGSGLTTTHLPPPPSVQARPSRRRWLIPAVVAVVLAGALAVVRPFPVVTSSTAPVPSGQPAIALPAPVATSRSAAAPATTAPSQAASASTPAPTASTPATSGPPSAVPVRTGATAVTTRATVARTPAVGSQIWNHGTGTCLHLPSKGGQVQLWQCNGSDNQRFDFSGDGTLRVLGQCVESGSTASGSRLRATACSGLARQQFTLNGARDLISVPADLCVDVPDWNGGNGVPAQIWACAGTDNQKWN